MRATRRIEKLIRTAVEDAQSAVGSPEMERGAERTLKRDANVLARRQLRIGRRNLERPHQAEQCDIGRRKACDVAPRVVDLAGRRRDEFGQQVEDRSLPRAIRTDERMNGVAANTKVEARNDRKVAEALYQRFGPQYPITRGIARGHRGVLRSLGTTSERHRARVRRTQRGREIAAPLYAHGVYFLTSGHSLSLSALNARSPGMVSISL